MSGAGLQIQKLQEEKDSARRAREILEQAKQHKQAGRVPMLGFAYAGDLQQVRAFREAYAENLLGFPAAEFLPHGSVEVEIGRLLQTEEFRELRGYFFLLPIPVSRVPGASDENNSVSKEEITQALTDLTAFVEKGGYAKIMFHLEELGLVNLQGNVIWAQPAEQGSWQAEYIETLCETCKPTSARVQKLRDMNSIANALIAAGLEIEPTDVCLKVTVPAKDISHTKDEVVTITAAPPEDVDAWDYDGDMDAIAYTLVRQYQGQPIPVITADDPTLFLRALRKFGGRVDTAQMDEPMKKAYQALQGSELSRHIIPAKGNGSCAYNSFLISMILQFETEGPNGYWHQWLQSDRAEMFWVYFNTEGLTNNVDIVPIPNENRVQLLQNFLNATPSWEERQIKLEPILRQMTSDIMIGKLDQSEDPLKNYFERLTANILGILAYGVQNFNQSDNITSLRNRFIPQLVPELGQEIATNIVSCFNFLDVIVQEIQKVEADRSIKNKNEHYQKFFITKIQPLMWERLNNFMLSQANRQDLLCAQRYLSLHAGEDELEFLARFMGVGFATTTSLHAPRVRAPSGAPMIVLEKTSGAHWNACVTEAEKRQYDAPTVVTQRRGEQTRIGSTDSVSSSPPGPSFRR